MTEYGAIFQTDLSQMSSQDCQCKDSVIIWIKRPSHGPYSCELQPSSKSLQLYLQVKLQRPELDTNEEPKNQHKNVRVLSNILILTNGYCLGLEISRNFPDTVT